MARKDPQFNVRMPQELKEMIEASAKDNQRSINAEIVHHLRNAMEAAGYINDDLIGAHRPIGAKNINSTTKDQEVFTASSGTSGLYKRKQKHTLKTDIPDEVLNKLIIQFDEAWATYKSSKDK